MKILLRLVNQILEFRAYENGKIHFHPTPTNILDCFENWNEAFQESARKKHIHFSFDSMPDTNFQTIVDVEKLERIYFNLLSNRSEERRVGKECTRWFIFRSTPEQ